MKKHPFIIIFDIDQTIIGNVNMQSKENDLLEFIYNTCKKKGINNECQNIDLDMQEELNNGLLRPYVRDFITLCDKKFKNVEVFFYTNSNYKWTNKILGKSIEKALNIKINRPFFTRENSMTHDLKKSLANVYPLIIKSLVKKYPSMKYDQIKNIILSSSLKVKNFEGKILGAGKLDASRALELAESVSNNAPSARAVANN